MNKLPPRSLFGLLQEDLVPNEWMILISCMMLNCTSRKQVEKVFPTFIKNGQHHSGCYLLLEMI